MDIWIIPKENVVDKNKTMANLKKFVQPVHFLLIMHKDKSLIPTTHVKMPGVVADPYNYSTGEA